MRENPSTGLTGELTGESPPPQKKNRKTDVHLIWHTVGVADVIT